MGYVQTVAPTDEPVSLEGVKARARILGNSEDVYLADLIRDTRDYVEKALSRQLITATWMLYLDAFPEEIILEKLPVAAVTKIEYLAGNVWTTVAPATYQVATHCPDSPARIQTKYGAIWPTPDSVLECVRVTFTAGYGGPDDVPPIFRSLLTLLVSHWYENREPVNVGNIVSTLPHGIDSLLSLADARGYG